MPLIIKRLVAAAVCIIMMFISPAISSSGKTISTSPLPITLYCEKNTKKLSLLTDRKRSSVWKWRYGSTLHIKSKGKIRAIYIIWDRKPAAWKMVSPTDPVTTSSTATTTTTTYRPTSTTSTVATKTTTSKSTSATKQTTDTTGQTTQDEMRPSSPAIKKVLNSNKYLNFISSIKGGRGGFLHEFVTISNPVSSIALQLEEGDGVIADIYAFESDNVPDWVQNWKPMLDKADMLLFSTHADDEHLWFGGTLPVYAGEYKKNVQVAYLIRHGNARNEYERNHELLDGLWKVGILNYPMISDFEDYYSTSLNKALSIYNEEAVLKYTVMLLRRFKPDVVLGHDENGEYGHGAHRLCSYSLKKAIHISDDSKQFSDLASKYGIWKIKKCYLHLYKKNKIEMDWNVPLKAFGGKTGLTMAKEGYKCHLSQQNKWFRVPLKDSPYDCQKFGLYYTSVGADIAKNDFFENISPVIPITTATTIARTTTTPTTTVSTNVSTTPYTAITTVADTPSITIPAGGSENSFSNNIYRYIMAGLKTIIIAIIVMSVIIYTRAPYFGIKHTNNV